MKMRPQIMMELRRKSKRRRRAVDLDPLMQWAEKPILPEPKPRRRQVWGKRRTGRRKRRGDRKKRLFEETSIGYFLKRYAPLEYSLIVKASAPAPPSPVLIERIGYASLSPIFRTERFHKALIRYRRDGLYQDFVAGKYSYREREK